MGKNKAIPLHLVVTETLLEERITTASDAELFRIANMTRQQIYNRLIESRSALEQEINALSVILGGHKERLRLIDLHIDLSTRLHNNEGSLFA